ncbi:cytochrome c [Arundinibacter roseus]|uniref:Cytochrome c n=2 Tax=Arundinibacter roseus TaxID=2070510 RepID=A0A4R4K869_9BACT|nr:cytochrome c [Arundinibacter roseus]
MTFLPIQPQGDELKESIARGKEIYNNYCISCHNGDGTGVPDVYPPLAGSDYVLEKPMEAAKAVKYGLIGPITVNGKEYDNMMPEAGLDDKEVADVVNYIRNTWGNSSAGKIITPAQVQELKSDE